jgi:hypothetical protein
MQIPCPSGLVGEFRNIKGHELAKLAEEADDAATPAEGGIVTIVRGCWQKLIDPGPYPESYFDANGAVAWQKVLKGDLQTMLFRLRASSVRTPDADDGPWGKGDLYVFAVRCEACGKRYEWEVHLSELPMKMLPEASKKVIATGNVSFETRVSDRKFVFTLGTLARDQPLEKLMKSQGRVKGTIIDILAARTLSIEGLAAQNDIRAKWNAIKDLDNWELQDLQAAYEAVDCGIETTIETRCDKADCRWPQEVELPMGKDFFSARKSRKRSQTTEPILDSEPTAGPTDQSPIPDDA